MPRSPEKGLFNVTFWYDKDMKSITTREDLEHLLDEMNINKGAVILLQADLHNMTGLVGGTTTLLETLLDRIGPKGVLIVPTFTLAALDPASQKHTTGIVDHWDKIRQNHPGYSSRTMPADVWKETAAAFLLHTKVKRTEHPVYSFAWMGPLLYKPALDSLDFPISYSHILQEMKRKSAVNLLIGVSPNYSIFPLLIAHEEGKDIIRQENAFVRKVKKTFEEPFLTSGLDMEGLMAVSDQLEAQESKLGRLPVYKITRVPPASA